MGSLESRTLGKLGHVARFEPQMVFEIQFLEGIARLAQWLVKHWQQRDQLLIALLPGCHAADVVRGDILVERRQRQIADQREEIVPVRFGRAAPAHRAQGIERAGREAPRRHLAALDEVGQHQGGDFRQLVAVSGQRRHGDPDVAEPRQQLGVPARLGQRRQRRRGGGDQPQIHAFQAVDRERQVHLLHLAERRQVRNEKRAAADLLQHLRGQGAAQPRQVEPGRARRLQCPGADFRHAARRPLEQEQRRLGRRLFQPPPEFLDHRRARECLQRQQRTL